jgi:glc operon protein GlcG
MYQKDFLSLEEARKAADAILDAASKKDPFYPIAVGVFDLCGDLIYFAKLDGASRNAVRLATNKAYTSALMRRSTRALAEFMQKNTWSLETWGDDKYTDVAGGVCILKEDGFTAIAGVGVAGIPTAEGDEELALLGPEALGLTSR